MVTACGGSDVQTWAGAPAAEEAPGLSTAAPHDALVLQVAATGNTARYRVREQLVGFDLPNDAVGTTTAVSGRIVLDDAGALVPGESAITVDVTGIESDQSRRDGYVRRNVLMTEQHPTVVLKPTAVRGLPRPVPTSGTHTFEMIGDLTVVGVTRPTTWRVTATFAGSGITGTAATRFAFDDFGMTKPRVRSVLSVADSIGLEYDFNLTASRNAP
jgi:polyisoprenoid-binding protein YceI